MTEVITIIVKDPTATRINVVTQPPAKINVQGNYLLGGATGNSQIFTSIAGEDMGGNKLVYIDNDKAFLFNPANTSLYGRCLGITTGAALQNDAVFIQVGGVMDWTSVPLTPGAVYYAGSNGALTTSPAQPVVQRVGHAIASNKLKINFDLNIVTI